ncbi:spondin-1 isoform X2 [Nematostella vectensis]|uniref:spondin-1 isoform X2 n=1 Tax=Nematostella vectensis TaxID=45351 RepID=UPI0013906820|nr:spondin-1 isoform X2 [Nematostella vectensis]
MEASEILLIFLSITTVSSSLPLQTPCSGKECSESHEVHRRALPLECCACGKATYKLTFKGKWSQETHARHHPGPMARWSPLIGCSHSNKYVMWRYGGIASRAVQMMSEWGATEYLDEEMRNQQENVMSIIQTPSLWYGVGESSAVFRVDSTRHLLSMISRMIPSPDWNVGVDRVNLCTTNCTWKHEETIDLIPWDAGTDDGITFKSPNARSTPKQPISRITTRLHDHPRASFYLNTNDQIRPFASLKLERLAVSGGCSNDAHIAPKNPYPPKSARIDCQLTHWSKWTSCSVTCGVGEQIRGRDIIRVPEHDGIPCPNLYEHRPCARQRCSSTKKCEVTPWSAWSSCRGSCGVGRKVRTRRIIRQSSLSGMTCPSLVKKRKCKLSPCRQGDQSQALDCVVTSWSVWSTCSRDCKGRMIRTRQILRKSRGRGRPCPRLRQKKKCNRSCKGSSK